jgi:LmbE family N-acetylglucosaminyl deacetylase
MTELGFDLLSRVMLIAPHPDDESLACSIALQQAVRAGASVRVVYATNGDDNPWPQRVLERKWRLNTADRKRWGKLRRTEALAALKILGIGPDEARFLGWRDQGLTDLLMRDCRSTLQHFAAIITGWSPTHLLVPSIADTHPDHNALGILLYFVLTDVLPADFETSAWSYVVHGRSAAFFNRAEKLPQSKIETARKKLAICCHKTQIKLSRRRFLAYANRPECLLKLERRSCFSGETDWREAVTRPSEILRQSRTGALRPFVAIR